MSPELSAPPLGLYVHMPWCVRKCPYCDFNSHALKGTLPAGDYIAALLDDLEQDLHRVWGRTVTSVYFGGGTPSLFGADEMAHLLSGIRARLPLQPDAEITLEANPGTIEHDSFSAYREAGVNRVSLGAQSFDDALLQAIGRIHGGSEVKRSIESIADSGLGNYNLDLMFGLPGQGDNQAIDDIQRAVAAAPPHISHYQLTLEPNTEFAVRPPVLPDEDHCWEIQEACESILQAAGYLQYETSAWSMVDRQCLHNLNYWQYGDYLGIGAGAHAKLTDAGAGEIRRLVKHKHPTRFMSGERVVEEKLINSQERRFEFFLNGLRLRQGCSRKRYEQRTGLAWSTVSEAVESAAGQGLLELTGDGFRPTEFGWRFTNHLQTLFLP